MAYSKCTSNARVDVGLTSLFLRILLALFRFLLSAGLVLSARILRRLLARYLRARLRSADRSLAVGPDVGSSFTERGSSVVLNTVLFALGKYLESERREKENFTNKRLIQRIVC